MPLPPCGHTDVIIAAFTRSGRSCRPAHSGPHQGIGDAAAQETGIAQKSPTRRVLSGAGSVPPYDIGTSEIPAPTHDTAVQAVIAFRIVQKWGS